MTRVDPAAQVSGALADRYRIERELGAGGMATVYLAADLKHDRKVAIKVLKPELAAVLGAERFVLEIKTTAALSHPHILPLFDSGEAGGQLYYVMPYIQGETIREKLNRETQFGVEEAVRIATEVADALDYAHRHGVIHRDVKPENILLHDGRAMVMDFGIALAVSAAAGGRMTETGMSLGTPHYMSPEQATADRQITGRSDIYSLASVLYEMLTGEPPHLGTSAQQVIMKIIAEPVKSVRDLRKSVPPHVAAAVSRALEKLPADRFTTAAAFAAALTDSSGASGVGVGGTTRRQGRARLLAAGFVGLALGGAGGYLAWPGDDSSADGVTRTYLRQPPEEALPGGTTDFVISPDGESMVYVGPGEQPGTRQLWRKRRAELHATRLAGTTGARAPVFSPDGASIAFYSSAGMVTLALAGGAPATVVPGVLGSPGRGAWLDDGRLVVADRIRLNVVNADGTQAERLVENSQFAGYNPVIVEAIPGSRGVLVQACPAQCPRAVVYAVDLRTKVARMILTDGRNPTYLPSGHLAYINNAGTLMVAPFDPAALEVRGEAVSVLERVAALSVSRTGDLVYREGPVGDASRAVWVDRSGRWTAVDSAWLAHVSSFSLSADGRRLAASVVSGPEQHIWLKDLPNGPLAKFTFGPLNHFRPFWSPDGRRVLFVRGDTTFGIAEKNADGSGDARDVRHDGRQVVEGIASRDGEWLVMRGGGSDTALAVLVMRRGVDTVARPIASGPGNKAGLALSPDGRHIAFLSNVSGTAEVYVSPFPEMATARWQVSLSSGLEPRWSPDGRELYYVTSKGELMAARISTSPTFAVLSTTRLFSVAGYARDGGAHMYEPEPGGQRFLMLRQGEFPGDLVIVQRWLGEIRGKLQSPR